MFYTDCGHWKPGLKNSEVDTCQTSTKLGVGGSLSMTCNGVRGKVRPLRTEVIIPLPSQATKVGRVMALMVDTSQ